MNDLDFIKNNTTRNNLNNAIEFLSFLWLASDNMKKDKIKLSSVYRQEIYRTIILYSSSIVEAILLDYCLDKKILFQKEAYAHSCVIDTSFPIKISKKIYRSPEVVVSIRHQEKKESKKGQISFHDLITVLRPKLEEGLAREVTKLKDERNSIHLTKKHKKFKDTDPEVAIHTLSKVIAKIKTW